ncbi:MAG: FixH family protein [Pseudomonadota bacterium]
MKTRVLALLAALGIVGFVGMFIWAAVRPPPTWQTPAGGAAPTASVSERLSLGRLDVQVYAVGNRNVRLDIQFMPDAGMANMNGMGGMGGMADMDSMRPDVNFAMVEMHMNEVDPPLKLVEPGVWRAEVELPMAGRWIVNVGFSEEFVEIEFDAK